MVYVTYNQKELKTKWPITSGLTAGTTSQTGRVENLLPTSGSTVVRRYWVGIRD